MEAIERVGTWWVPQAPRKRVPGRLTFNVEGGIRVELDGSVGDLAGDGAVLLGLCGGTKYTLINAESVNSTLSIRRGKIIHEAIKASLGYEGEHFRAPEEMVLALVSLRVSRMEQWLGAHTFSQDWIDQGYRLTWTPPPDFTCELDRVSFAIRSSLGTGWEYPDTPSFRESVLIQITSRDQPGLPWDDWRDSYVNPIQDLVTLGTDHATGLLVVGALTPTQLRSLRARRRPDLTGSVFYASRGTRGPSTESLMPGEMLFTLQDMRPSFVDSWLSLRRELSVVLDLFLSTIYSEGMYLEHRFLNYVQASEILHRKTMRNEVRPVAEHRKLVRRILSSVDQEDAKWLKDQLGSSNEPRLARRIEELVQDVGEPPIRVIGPDVSKFARLVRNMRNDLTHGNKPSEEIDYASMLFLSESLRLLLQAVFLRRLGASATDVEKLLIATRRYQRLLRWPVRDSVGS
jgi:hypothetical protein